MQNLNTLLWQQVPCPSPLFLSKSSVPVPVPVPAPATLHSFIVMYIIYCNASQVESCHLCLLETFRRRTSCATFYVLQYIL